MAGVVGVFLAGRRLWGAREGLVGAAVLTFAFLPVAYSRIAVTDVGTFLPVVAAVYGAVRAYETGARRYFVLAGAGTGAAMGFKYTAGLVLVPLLVAVLMRLASEGAVPGTLREARTRFRERGGLRGTLRGTWGLRRSPVVTSALLALVVMVVVFFISTPYFAFNLRGTLYQLREQAQAAGGSVKFGQTQESGTLYYLTSLTWGLGWAACAAALLGAVIEFRRNRPRAILLLLFPLVFFVFLSSQSRFFSRWLLPVYPILALFCGVALVQIVDRIRASRPLLRAAALVLLVGAVMAQEIAADIRTTQTLGKEDTRNLARDYLVDNFDPDLRVAIEPAIPTVPELYYQLRSPGSSERLIADVCTGLDKLEAAANPSLGRGRKDCLPTRQERFVRNYLREIRRAVSIEEGGEMTANLAMLRPETIDLYRRNGFCVVVTMSIVRGRAVNAQDPRSLGYYERLERESKLLWQKAPYEKGAEPPKFDFDFSYNYYPTAFNRPGPEIKIYQLDRCTQGYDDVQVSPKGVAGLQKGIGTSFAGFQGTATRPGEDEEADPASGAGEIENLDE